MPELGVRATTIRLAWDAYEPKKGSFSWAELDEGVAKLHSCGVTISAHIRSTSRWGTQPQPGVPLPQTSMPPLNMQDYHDFVFALATRYRGLDIRWAIENEGAFSFYWGGTVDEYAELLRTGYGAIKAADPGAIVENDGIHQRRPVLPDCRRPVRERAATAGGGLSEPGLGETIHRAALPHRSPYRSQPQTVSITDECRLWPAPPGVAGHAPAQPSLL